MRTGISIARRVWRAKVKRGPPVSATRCGPDALERGNFWDALKGIVKGATAGTALHTTCELRGKLPELPPAWQENLLHIGQEALTNTLKDAQSRNFRARLNCNARGVRLELHDDGRRI